MINSFINKIRIYTILVLLILFIISCISVINYVYQKKENSDVISLLMSGKMPNEIKTNYWKQYFESPNNLYVATNDNYTIITENNIQTKRIPSWINAVFSLPKCEINNLNITKFDNDLRISVKISPSKIIK